MIKKLIHKLIIKIKKYIILQRSANLLKEQTEYPDLDLSGKLKASDSLISFISTLSSSIIQEECIKKVAQKLNLKENLLLEEMRKK